MVAAVAMVETLGTVEVAAKRQRLMAVAAVEVVVIVVGGAVAVVVVVVETKGVAFGDRARVLERLRTPREYGVEVVDVPHHDR